MRIIILLSLLVLNTTGFSQHEFFRSEQSFSKEDLKEFYSSVAVRDDIIAFVANDHNLYVYKKDGQLSWRRSLNYKSNIPPFFTGNRVWLNAYEDRHETVRQFNTETGEMLPLPGISKISTTPFVRDSIMYATGIIDLGCIFAYDLKGDTLRWQRFLAHGHSAEPYYFNDRIVANAEGNRWIDLRYDGKLAKAGCEDTPGVFPSELSCAREFEALTHDQLEIKQPGAAKWITESFEGKPSVRSSRDRTFVYQELKLFIIGNKLRQKDMVDIQLPESNSQDGNAGLSEILKLTEEKIWIAAGSSIVCYNYKTKKMEDCIDLFAWQPHRVVMDNDKIWLISKKDGLLYGLYSKNNKVN